MRFTSVILFFITLQFAPNLVKAQIARLIVQKGTTVNFIFDTLKEYSDGIAYSNWTKVGVYYNDEGSGLSWKMNFKALTSSINGSDSNTLNLNTIRVTASNGGPNSALNYYGNVFLTDSYTVLVSGGPEGSILDNVVNLSYDVGVINKVMNAKPDYYSVDIVIMVLAE